MKRQRGQPLPVIREGHGLLIGLDANVVRSGNPERISVTNGASERFSEAGTGRCTEVIRKFPDGMDIPHWPEDPAQSPNLFCPLEARLADGHRIAEQTMTIQDGNTSHPFPCPVLPDSPPDILQLCLCSSPDGDSAVNSRQAAA